MTDTDNAADVGAPAPVAPPAEIRGSTPRELARGLSERWRQRDEQASSPDTGEMPAAKPPPATPAPTRGNSREELADAAPPQEVTGETSSASAETAIEEPGPDETSVIPMPRSWTREHSEHWNTLPRETQAYIAQREQERDRAINKYQSDHAEKLRGLTAKEQLVEQARQYYEQTLPVMQETLQNRIAGEFSDIKTMADARMLAQVDPQRYSRWDAAQKELALVTEQATKAQQDAQRAQQDAWNKWAIEQDKLFVEKAPELSDPVKGPKYRDATFGTLKNVGFSQDELVQSWNAGQLRDHRVQLLIYKAARFDLAEAEGRKKAAIPVPQVQKPGVSRPRGAGDSEAIDALRQQFHKKQDVRSGAALLAARWRSRS